MKIVLQDGIKDCGICSLLSIIRFFGGDVSKEYLREITNTTKNGVSAYNLIEGARKLGFIADGMSGDLSKIDDNNLPCLAHVVINKNYKHFVVIYKINKQSEKITIMDPSKGKRVLSFSEFKLLTTNNYIFLRPTKKLPFLVKRNVVKKMILLIIKENKKYIFLLGFLIITYFVFSVLAAFHFKYLLEFSINVGVSANILIISIILLVIYIFKILNEVFRNILFVKMGSVIDKKLTQTTFKQILLLPYLYYKNRTTGEVITRLKDLTIVKNFLSKLFSTIITDLLSLFVFFILIFKISKKVSLILVCFVFIQILFTCLRKKKKRKLYQGVCRKEERINSYLIESLNDVDTIKGSHIEKRLADKFLLKYQDLLEKSYVYTFFVEIGKFINNTFNDILIVIVYFISAYLVIKEKINIGEIFLLQNFIGYFLNSINSFINLIEEYYTYTISLGRIEDLYTISSEKFFGSYYYYAYDLSGDIVFKNLSYKYSSKKILDNINFVIKKGEKILLVGQSGSGKSSLVKILMRYLEVPFGMCKIAGIDINHYHLENIRKNISYVSSLEFLFTDTLYNNITLHKDVSEDDFSKVVSITRVDEIVNSKNEGYHMMVEENGFNFSNGERQRIILSRCLLKKSNIYIFDEAFGQIDIYKEKEILSDVFSYLKDKTIIVISHRFNNKKLFDRVIKLKDGKLYEN